MTTPQDRRRTAHEEYELAYKEKHDKDFAAFDRAERVARYWFVAGITIVVIGVISMIYGVGRGFGWW